MKLSALAFFIMPVFYGYAQNFTSTWEGHYSYLNINDISLGNETFYASSDNAVFSYDFSSEEINKLSTIHGLSGDAISTLIYLEKKQLLVIGFENGLIQIYDEVSQSVLNVVDIVLKTSILDVNKRINHFYFDNDLLLISTNFGISEYDILNLEFGDTFFIGANGAQERVSQTVVFNNFIYAATPTGIKRGAIDNPNLVDFSQWQTVFVGNWNFLQALKSKLYAVKSDKKLYELSSGSPLQVASYERAPNDFRIVNSKLIISTSTTVFMYNENEFLEATVNENTDYNTHFTSAVYYKSKLFIGTKGIDNNPKTGFGVLSTSLSSLNVFQSIHPNGPLANRPFAVEAVNNKVWVTYGSHSVLLNPYPLKRRGFSYFNTETWDNTLFNDTFDAVCLNTILINPLNTDEAFIASYFSGILKVVNSQPELLYDNTNSGLHSIFTNSKDIRIKGATVDSDGVYWFTNSIVDEPLVSFNIDTNLWQSYDFTDIIADRFSCNGFPDLAVDSNKTVWVGSYNYGIIGYNYNNGNYKITNVASTEKNMPSNLVNTVELDANNQLWVGTQKGLRVVYNTTNFFDEAPIAEEIIISENGIGQELLFNQFITDIEVDGANNKWISTLDTGVYYFSSNGQNTIYHFTKDNSPLPSNNVIDMAIDKSTGKVFMASEKGLVVFKSEGVSSKTDFETVKVFPNPVRPNFNLALNKIKIEGLTENVNIKILDVEGNLVNEASSKVNSRFNGFHLEIDGGTAFWNGKNLSGNQVATGVYLIVLSDLDTFESKTLKLLVVR